MGATTFVTTAKGKTASAAFAAARERACYEHGHGGYTGTIAEKQDFVMIERAVLDPAVAAETAQRLLDADDRRVADKWGPAGCLQIGPDAFLFFGWASC